MRTTINIDEDILDRARTLKEKLHISFKAIVNQALREGLKQVGKPAEQKPYRTRPRRMELREGYNLDNIQEVLAQGEGEDFR